MPPTQAQSPPTYDGEDDYSSAVTLTHFPHHLPLLRRPIKVDDDPNFDQSLSPYILAFDSPLKRAQAKRHCEAQLTDQCLAGARIGCSLAASEKCKPPWWQSLLRGSKADDFRDREKCEEMETKACVDVAERRCGEFAKKRCGEVFGKAKVCVVSGNVGIFRLICDGDIGEEALE